MSNDVNVATYRCSICYVSNDVHAIVLTMSSDVNVMLLPIVVLFLSYE